MYYIFSESKFQSIYPKVISFWTRSHNNFDFTTLAGETLLSRPINVSRLFLYLKFI